MIKKLLFLFVVLFGLSQAKILMFNDISVEPLDRAANPDFQPAKPLHRKGVYLVTYADGNEIFFKNQHALSLSALNKGIDFILNYRRSHLDPDFVQKNARILNEPRGAGYWLWKPWVILKTLNSVPENAIVVYADSGFVFRNNIQKLLANAEKNDITLIYYDPKANHFDQKSVETHASRNVLERMQCDTLRCRQKPHLWAGFMVLRNTPKSRTFIKKWLQYSSDPNIMINMPDSRTQYPNFKNHLDDETILSVLHAKEPQGKFLIEAMDLLNHYVFWHHRKPGNYNGGSYTTLLPRMFKQIRGIERKILNAYPVERIRQFLLEHFPVIYRAHD